MADHYADNLNCNCGWHKGCALREEIARLREALEKIESTTRRAQHVPLERLYDIRALASAALGEVKP